MDVWGRQLVVEHRPRVSGNFILIFSHHWRDEAHRTSAGRVQVTAGLQDMQQLSVIFRTHYIVLYGFFPRFH